MIKPFFWALLAALTWGCVPILEKLGLAKIPVFAGLFYRCIGVMLGFGLLLLFKFNIIKDSFGGMSYSWIYLIAGGFLASFVGQIFFYHALKSGEASRVTPLAATFPLITFVLGVLFLGEKITLSKVIGMLCVIAGVLFLK